MGSATAVTALGIVSARWQASAHEDVTPAMGDGPDNCRALVDNALEALVFRIAYEGKKASDEGVGIRAPVMTLPPLTAGWLAPR